MRRCRTVAVILFVAAPFLTSCGQTAHLPSQDQSLAQEPSFAPDGGNSLPATKYEFRASPFGLHAAQGAFADAKDLGAKWCRVMVRWGDAEPRPGRYELERMDAVARQVQLQGLQLVPSLVAISDWGVEPTIQKGAGKGKGKGKGKKKAATSQGVKRYSAPPKNMAAWLKFVRLIVERYDGDGIDDMPGLQAPLNHWQVENEWLWQWQGTEKEYVDLLIQSSRTIKDANPNAKVISAGSTKVAAFGLADGLVDWDSIDLGETDQNRQRAPLEKVVQSQRYIDARQRVEYLLREGRDAFDIVDVHCYSASPWELAVDGVWLKNEMKKNNYDKPIWSLETAGPFFDFSEERFAEDVVKRQLIGLTHGFDCLFWSSLTPTLGWSDNYVRLALIDTSGRKTPAYYTYRLLTTQLNGMKSIEPMKTPPGLFAVRVRRNDATDVIVGWSEGAEREISFPFEGPAARMTHIITGRNQSEPRTERVAVANGKLTLRVSTPVFLERAD